MHSLISSARCDGSSQVPQYIHADSNNRSSGSLVSQDSRIEILRPGLPDPAMSTLRIDSTVGACSEKFQEALRMYIEQNPDGVISPVMSESTVTEDALELLVWIKYSFHSLKH